MSSTAPKGRKPVKDRGKDLHSQYRLTVMVGMIVSLSVLTLLVRADFTGDRDAPDIQLVEQEVVQMEEIQQTAQIERPPPPPRPPVPVEVPNDMVFEDEEIDFDASLDLDEAIGDLPPPPPQPVFEEKAEEEIEIFVVVEEMPEIIGGTARIYELLEYPEIARQAGVEGLVVVQVVVEPSGKPSNPEVVRSAGEVLDRAAVQAVMNLDFKPGLQRGQAVRVKLAIPIRFRLREAANN